MVISFAGHSSLNKRNELKEILLLKLSELLKSTDYIHFYCGGYGDFDNLCAETLFELKKFYSKFEVLLILPYLSSTQNTRPSRFDTTLYPPLENVPKKLAIIKRNEWIVDQSDLIIAYVSYTFGGAYRTIQYAKRKNKTIFNSAEPNLI